MTDHSLNSAYREGISGAEIGELTQWSERFAPLSAFQRVERALHALPGNHIVTSSFGAQSAVSLHMLSQAKPGIVVVLIDTGYLFPETYAFINEMREKLDLNLHVYRSLASPAWQEVTHGKRWLQGTEGIEKYNFENKVEPMQRALDELKVGTWFTGIRRNQSSSRTTTPFVQRNGDYYKVAPLADWSDKDVFDYLKTHDLPYHPLWEQGYVSIGDVHTTASLHDVESAADTRFFGLKRECGLHEVL